MKYYKLKSYVAAFSRGRNFLTKERSALHLSATVCTIQCTSVLFGEDVFTSCRRSSDNNLKPAAFP